MSPSTILKSSTLFPLSCASRPISSTARDRSKGCTSRMKSHSLLASRSSRRLAIKPGNPVMNSVSLSGIDYPEYNSRPNYLTIRKGQIHEPPFDVGTADGAGSGAFSDGDLLDRRAGQDP